MAGFGDYKTSLKMRDVVERLAKAVIERERPRYQYATVSSIDAVNRKCQVVFTGDTNPVTVTMGSIQPSAVGQMVRVGGIGSDKFIEDVMGAAAGSGGGSMGPHAATHATGGTDPVSPASIGAANATHGHAIGDLPVAASGTSSATALVRADDSRLSNTRTPTAHAASHGSGGSDPVTPGAIGAAAAVHTHTKSQVTDFAHSHAAADVTAGTLDIARLPVGMTATTVARGDHAHSQSSVSLDSLTDVTITSPVQGSVLYFDSGQWIDAIINYASVGAAPAAHGHAASDVTSGVFSPDRLGSGARDGTKFLRDDGVWAPTPAGNAADTSPPVGAMMLWPGEVAPSGWLFAEGGTFSSVAYPVLYNVLGTTTLPRREPEYASVDEVTSGVVSAASGYSVTAQNFQRHGRMVNFVIGISRTGGNIGINNPEHANQTIGTLNSAWWPALTTTHPLNSGLRHFYISTTGVIQIVSGIADGSYTNSNINTNDALNASGTYMLSPPSGAPRHRWIIRAV